jgi:hypothetical protein
MLSLLCQLQCKVSKMSDMLSVFYWNVRGLNAPMHREIVQDMIQSLKPKLVCLQEMKLASISPQIATEFLGASFDGFQFLLATGTRGEIVVGWCSDFIEASSPVFREFSMSMDIGVKALVFPFG